MAELILELARVDEAIDLCERWLRTCEGRVFENDASASSSDSSEYSNKLVEKTHTALVDRLIEEAKTDQAVDVCRQFLVMYRTVFGEKPHALVVHARQCTVKVLREQAKEV